MRGGFPHLDATVLRRAFLGEAQQDKTRATLAEQATAWVKPLVALAGGVINGNTDVDVESVMSN